MKTKNLILLGSILIVVVALIMLTEKLSSQKSAGKSKLFFPGFSPTDITAFRISDKSNAIKIQRKGDSWVIASSSKEKKEEKEQKLEEKEEEGASLFEKTEGKEPEAASEKSTSLRMKDYPADSASVESLLEKLSMMSRDELISQNVEKQALFEVDTAKGTFVEVWDNQNKLLGSFFIGKSGPDWSSHYVRSLGSNDVYSVRGSIKYSFFTDVNRWRNKIVCKFNKTMVKKVTLARKDSAAITLEKSLDTAGVALWNITAPVTAPADSAAVAQIINNISDLKTSKWEENLTLKNEDMGFDDPSLIVSVELEDGEKKIVSVGKKQSDTEKWVKTGDSDAIFILSETKFIPFEKSVKDLQKKEDAKKEEKKS